MIKLFSLNHTRTRKFLILAQDKTQFRRVTVLIFRIRNTSASAHTNYLVNLLYSVCVVLFEEEANATFFSETVNADFYIIFLYCGFPLSGQPGLFKLCAKCAKFELTQPQLPRSPFAAGYTSRDRVLEES